MKNIECWYHKEVGILFLENNLHQFKFLYLKNKNNYETKILHSIGCTFGELGLKSADI